MPDTARRRITGFAVPHDTVVQTDKEGRKEGSQKTAPPRGPALPMGWDNKVIPFYHRLKKGIPIGGGECRGATGHMMQAITRTPFRSLMKHI